MWWAGDAPHWSIGRLQKLLSLKGWPPHCQQNRGTSSLHRITGRLKPRTKTADLHWEEDESGTWEDNWASVSCQLMRGTQRARQTSCLLRSCPWSQGLGGITGPLAGQALCILPRSRWGLPAAQGSLAPPTGAQQVCPRLGPIGGSQAGTLHHVPIVASVRRKMAVRFPSAVCLLRFRTWIEKRVGPSLSLPPKRAESLTLLCRVQGVGRSYTLAAAGEALILTPKTPPEKQDAWPESAVLKCGLGDPGSSPSPSQGLVKSRLFA